MTAVPPGSYLISCDGKPLGTAVSEADARQICEQMAEADGGPGDGMDWQWWNVDQNDWRSPLALYAVCDGHDEATGYLVTRVEHEGGVR